jgi:hypothetical protein
VREPAVSLTHSHSLLNTIEIISAVPVKKHANTRTDPISPNGIQLQHSVQTAQHDLYSLLCCAVLIRLRIQVDLIDFQAISASH